MERKETCSFHSARLSEKPDFLVKETVTEKETWVFQYKPEAKAKVANGKAQSVCVQTKCEYQHQRWKQWYAFMLYIMNLLLHNKNSNKHFMFKYLNVYGSTFTKNGPHLSPDNWSVNHDGTHSPTELLVKWFSYQETNTSSGTSNMLETALYDYQVTNTKNVLKRIFSNHLYTFKAAWC